MPNFNFAKVQVLNVRSAIANRKPEFHPLQATFLIRNTCFFRILRKFREILVTFRVVWRLYIVGTRSNRPFRKVGLVISNRPGIRMKLCIITLLQEADAHRVGLFLLIVDSQ